MEELGLSVKTKRRVSEKKGKSECKFRLIITVKDRFCLVFEVWVPEHLMPTSYTLPEPCFITPGLPSTANEEVTPTSGATGTLDSLDVEEWQRCQT